MEICFYKYQGTGNDFVMIDNRTAIYDKIKEEALVKRLCDRRFGIGGDGLILLENYEGADFNMIYYNSDGRLSSMCGNGGRCIAAFAVFLGIVSEKAIFMAPDGMHEAIIQDELVSLKMNDVFDIETLEHDFALNTGSPHYITFVEDIEAVSVDAEGRAIRYNDRFREEGINVNMVEIQGKAIKVRTYERGVEDETYSCGTGVTAAAIAYILKIKSEFGRYKIPVSTKGGQLAVSFLYHEKGFTDIELIGPAEQVFSGVFDQK